MKRLLLFICTLFISTNLFSQDWQLFPSNFKTYYLQKNFFDRVWGEFSNVFEIQFNQVKLVENHYLFTSERIDPIYNVDSCLYHVRKFQDSYAGSIDNLMIDRYEIRNDTLIYYLENYGTILDSSKYIYIPLQPTPGDSLLVNNIKIKFVEKKFSEIIQGVSDSVLVFYISLNNHQNSGKDTISLSKNHGILGLVSFKKILNYELIRNENINLIGLENLISHEHYGYEPKKMQFKDLIKFKAGDTRYWSFGNYDYTWGEHCYYKDTIISVIEGADSLKLTFQRTSYYNNKPVSSEMIVESYNIKDWDLLLADRQNSYNKIYHDFWFSHFRENKTSLILQNGYAINNHPKLDTLFDFSVNPICIEDFGTRISTDCKLDGMTDSHSHDFYAVNVGMFLSYMFGTSNEVIWELIAYTLEGEFHGKIPDKFYSVDDKSEVSLISPNPASDFINVDASFLRMQESAIKIFDVFGNCVLNVGAIHELSLRIDISTLPAGVYFVRIGDKVEKFIKL